MNSLLNELYAAAVPLLITAFGTILTIVLDRATKVARERWGIEIEATHRAALHSALMSGVRAALLRGLSGREAVEAAIIHASGSVPDAIIALKPDAGVLTRIAEAKLGDALNELPILGGMPKGVVR